MARIGRPCRIAVVVALCIVARSAADDPTQTIAATLAMQDAMRQGRELLQRGQAKSAVDVLEAQVARINGNAQYLALLRDAYYAYIRDLQLSSQDELYATYLKRLQILDKNARVDAAPIAPKMSGPPVADAPKPPPAARTAAPDDDPLQQTPRRKAAPSRELLPEAEKAFAEKRYGEADDLFARAYGTDEAAPAHAPQWAYSILTGVVARLAEADSAGSSVPAAELERDVAAALRLAANNPELTAFGRTLSDTLRQRGAGQPAVAAPAVIRHLDRDADGWSRAESANYRLFHTQSPETAERVLQAAELGRSAAFEKWAGPPRGNWQPACEVYLHATAADYSRNTTKPGNTPGHATFKIDKGVVVRRRLDLRADEPATLVSVIPHETTHLVLGDLFADAPLPRWADEGMAVLAEPRAQIDRYTRTLHRCRQQRQLVPLEQLLSQADYPAAPQITPFYAESVSLVDFLVAEKGPRVLTQFLRDLRTSGPDAALAKHYGCRTVTELQDRWLRRTFPDTDIRTTTSGR